MKDLSRADRLLLLRFVCSFVWADDRVRPEERGFVASLMARLELEPDERRQVEAWLEVPPPAESVDPARIPPEHRLRFLRVVESALAVDGEVVEAERKRLLAFARQLR